MSISANLRAPDTRIVGLCARKGTDPRLWDYTSNTTHSPDEVRLTPSERRRERGALARLERNRAEAAEVAA